MNSKIKLLYSPLNTLCPKNVSIYHGFFDRRKYLFLLLRAIGITYFYLLQVPVSKVIQDIARGTNFGKDRMMATPQARNFSFLICWVVLIVEVRLIGSKVTGLY